MSGYVSVFISVFFSPGISESRKFAPSVRDEPCAVTETIGGLWHAATTTAQRCHSMIQYMCAYNAAEVNYRQTPYACLVALESVRGRSSARPMTASFYLKEKIFLS